jgi:AcrR family transcriptional regulator
MTATDNRAYSPESRAQDSRDEILKAATKLFASRGVHETSMSEVARAAHVSKALIFWHFKTKEDLFFAVLNRLLEPYVIDFAEEAGVLDEKAQILKLVESYIFFVRDNASSIRFFIAQLLHGDRTFEALTNQVMALYDGYRALLTDLIFRAQEKALCSREWRWLFCSRLSMECCSASCLSAITVRTWRARWECCGNGSFGSRRRLSRATLRNHRTAPSNEEIGCGCEFRCDR